MVLENWYNYSGNPITGKRPDDRLHSYRIIIIVLLLEKYNKVKITTCISMDAILRFLQTYEVWGYIFLGGIGFIYFQKLFTAIGELRLAIYGLEREAALRRITSNMSILILVILLGLTEFFVVSFIAPAYPQSGFLPTPTIDLLSTATVTIEPGSAFLAYPEDATPVASQDSPGAVPETNSGCIPGELEWTYPLPGEEINGTIELRGTVNLVNMGFYKYEFSQVGSDKWETIAAGNQLKKDEPLGGAWNTEQRVPGDYTLRLVVADNLNQLLPACEINIRIIPSP